MLQILAGSIGYTQTPKAATTDALKCTKHYPVTNYYILQTKHKATNYNIMTKISKVVDEWHDRNIV